MTCSINDKIIGKHIQEARKKKNLTQGACAAALNVSVSYFGRIERGVIRINLERLFEISKLLTTSAFQILQDCCPSIDQALDDTSLEQSPAMKRILNTLKTATPQMIELISALSEVALDILEKPNTK